MQLLLPWQQPRLSDWASRSIHPLAARERVPTPFHDRLVITLAEETPGEPENDGVFARLEESVLAYRIFGSEIGCPLVERTPVQVGDTIGLVYRFLGLFEFFFASRVVEVFVRHSCDGGYRSGFVYRTLEGHPELGEEVFEVKKDSAGVVTFRIEAWSRPNLWYVKLFTLWARKIQKAAAFSAAAHLAQLAAL